MTNFESANGRLLQVQPHQSSNDRRLVEVLVHFLVIIRCLPPNPLLQPLVALAFDPASMTVIIVSYILFRQLYHLNQNLNDLYRLCIYHNNKFTNQFTKAEQLHE